MSIRSMRLYGFMCIFLCIICFFAYRSYTRPLISVVMPTHNKGGELVERAIKSILNQTFKDFEFIIIDDASTDDSVAIIDKYAQQDKRIRLIRNKTNKGIAFSRDLGNKLARAKYVAIMDSDDSSFPERLEKSFNFMEKNPQVTVMFGNFVWDNDNPQEPIQHKKQKLYTVDSSFSIVNMLFFNPVYNVTSIYRIDFIRDHEIHYNKELIAAEDYDVWKQILLAGGRFQKIKDILVNVHYHRSNSDLYYQKIGENAVNIRKELMDYLFPNANKSLKNHTLQNKCDFLNELYEQNKLVHLFETWDLVHINKMLCPPQTAEEVMFLEHQEWSDYIVFDKEKGKYLLHNRDEIPFSKKGDKIFFKTPQGKDYIFLHDTDKTYIYTTNKTYNLKHNIWEDSIFLTDETHFCKQHQQGECGQISFEKNHTIRLNWNNPSYETEYFKLKGKIYEKITPPEK